MNIDNHLKESKIAIVLGTRPEAIKLAPLIHEFKTNTTFDIKVFLTGQHDSLIDPIIKLFNIEIFHRSFIHQSNLSLSEKTSLIITKLTPSIIEFDPKLLIVQGDTNSSLASSLISFYSKIPLAHVEAGLSSGQIMDPFPEEINRRLISQMASLNFAPTDYEASNLKSLGAHGEIHVTGNTIVDSVKLIEGNLPEFFLKNVNLSNKKLILATFHRRDNWGKNLEYISSGILKVINNFPNVVFIIPLHPNPKVREPLEELLGSKSQVYLVEPLNYDFFLSLLKKSYLIITDSGGIQEEAPIFGKPVLVVRNSTERLASLNHGISKVIGTSSYQIYNETSSLLIDSNKYNKMCIRGSIYGDGFASKRIVSACTKFLLKNN